MQIGYVMDLSLSAILVELGQGVSLHLFHHLAPMHFDSASLVLKETNPSFMSFTSAQLKICEPSRFECHENEEVS
jgi:hypothetical protein